MFIRVATRAIAGNIHFIDPVSTQSAAHPYSCPRTPTWAAAAPFWSNLNMLELIAQTQQEYLLKTVELARDLPRLSAYRAELRERLLNSPLLDTARFARNVEAAYRKMWRKWCAGIAR